MNGATVIRALLARCVHYVADFWLVLYHPGRFNEYRTEDIGRSIGRANSFLVISLALSIALSALVSPPAATHWEHVVGLAIFNVVAVVLGVLAIQASWYAVGGRAPLRGPYLVYSYHFGVLIVWSTVVEWFADIAGRLVDPPLHPELHGIGNRFIWDRFIWNRFIWAETESPAYLASTGIVAAGFLGMLVWWIVAWGAYRRLYGLSRSRSVASFLIASVLFVLIAIALWIFTFLFLLAEHRYYFH